MANTCPDCGGDGYNDDNSLCETCMGQGSLPVRGLHGFIKEKFNDVIDQCNDILDKCNDILEQISQ